MTSQSPTPRPRPFATVAGAANRANAAPNTPPQARWRPTASAIVTGFGARSPRSVATIALGIGSGIGDCPVTIPASMSTDITTVATMP